MIDTVYLQRCIQALQKAQLLLQAAEPDSIDYDMYRSACVKEFEIILEQSGKLLKKALKPYFHTSKAVDVLSFKDAFRQANLHSLLTLPEVTRWFNYRDNRNNTAHDYGAGFAEETLALLPQFIVDAQALAQIIATQSDT